MPRPKGSLNKNVFTVEFTIYNDKDRGNIIKQKKYVNVDSCINDNQELGFNRHQLYRISRHRYKNLDKWGMYEVKMINNLQNNKIIKIEKLKEKLKKLECEVHIPIITFS